MRITSLVILLTWLLLGAPVAADTAKPKPRTAHDCSDIALRVCSIDPSFDPSDPNHQTPTCQIPDQSTGADRNFIITTILNQTNGQLTKALCSAENIFIFKSSTLPSWGLYQDPTYHPPSTDPSSGNTYIGINDSDLNMTFSKKQIANSQQLSINNTLLNFSESGLPSNVVPEVYGLLYTLSHEYSHILWHQAATTSRPCKDNIKGSWADDISNSQPRWTTYGYSFNTHSDNTIPDPHSITKGGQIDSIYSGGFATALAASNPEEDFVDSYSLGAITKSCGSSCKFDYTITLDSGNLKTIPLNSDRGNNTLQGKLACAGNLQNFP